MRRNGNLHIVRPFSDRKWLLPFIGSLLVSITLFFAFFFRIFSSPYGEKSTSVDLLSFGKIKESSEFFIESNFKLTNGDSRKEAPRIAYLISGTKGDSQRMRRTLKAIYHPRNQYILHLDLEAPPRERINLTMSIKVDPTFREVGNVRVMAQSNLVTYRGPTMIAATLQAVAILLKESSEWDWFINLSASDYPLVTQDDLLHVFSNLSRGLNFIEHSELSGWKVNQRAKSIIVDPGLYLSKKSDIFTTSRHRSLPTSFKLFAGSAWVLLTRSFLEFCIWGWDNLPRKVLMYYTNFVSSPEGYFHTVICNAEEFKKTAISHDLHYIAWDSPPKQHPRILTIKDFNDMVQSGAPFARKFTKNDPVLDKIDRELLKRSEEQFVPGAWCNGRLDTDEDPCLLRGNSSVFQPGPGAERLRGLVQKILSENPEKKRCGS